MDQVAGSVVTFGLVGFGFIASLTAVRLWYTTLKHSEDRSMTEFLTCLCLISAVLFLLTTVPLIIFGSMDGFSCHGAYIPCMCFYLMTKMLTYLIFVEKAYIVNKGMYRGPRLKFRLYQVNIILFAFIWLEIVTILVFHSRESAPVETTHKCFHGLSSNRIVYITMNLTDVLFCTYLTVLFIYPLCASMKSVSCPRLTRLVRKGLIGCAVTLVSTTVTSVLLAILHYPRWEVCIAICMLDSLITSTAANYSTGLDTVLLTRSLGKSNDTATTSPVLTAYSRYITSPV
mmetsp:Transcript_4375/g.7450  ORF Transcript_4375/g.7450 Transcript_4375/m.7450 type:complete len:287 (-) Transcript_4375:2062-2922(-)